jgi:hypothetical protein
VYRVSYSERVLEEFAKLISRNPDRENIIRTAFREINRRLRIYPQFGEAKKDLSIEPAQLWIGSYPPLAIHYVLVEYDEDQAAATGFHGEVMVVRPFKPLPHSGIV